jgi:membrane-bound serine protease (ClpP class)
MPSLHDIWEQALATSRRRNVDWAIRAVRESVIITDSKALKLNMVDLIAPNLTALLEQATGREVEVAEQRVSLALLGVRVRSAEMRLSHQFINFLAHPDIAYMLLVAGVLGLLLELATPGILVAGVGGVICLLLALTALQALPINTTGLVLIVLAVGLWIAEAFVPGFGILGIGGIVAFLLGSLTLFDVPGERLVVDPHMLTTVGTLLLCGDGSLGLPPDDGMESCASHGY